MLVGCVGTCWDYVLLIHFVMMSKPLRYGFGSKFEGVLTAKTECFMQWICLWMVILLFWSFQGCLDDQSPMLFEYQLGNIAFPNV